DPNNPATFKPCPAIQAKVAPGPPWWIWWDTFAIPSGRQIQLTCTKATCAPALQPYLQCPATGNCKEFIPGWFKMRSRFVDFTGQYVLHCHILIHEDRGMMQLVEVISDKTMYTHH
ncbi:MAG TPA: multicopper oxidase domain-containing protein, partial [Mycobacteriales bacterium]|nr:multicopper oxidase domain-containing protein [Mycobacteriales bacterium]